MDLSKTLLIRAVINALYTVSSRRTSSKFAEDTIENALKTLKNRYSFCKDINFKVKSFSEDGIDVNLSSNIEKVHKNL